MANGIKITDDEFYEYPVKKQNLILFRNIETFMAKYESDRETRFTICNARMEKIEKKQRVEFGLRNGIAVITGAISGFFAGMLKAPPD